MKNFNIMGGRFNEKYDFYMVFMKSKCIRGNYLKRRAWTVSRFKRGLGKKEEVVFFDGDCYPNAHYACYVH